MKFAASVWKRMSWNLTKFQLNQTTNRKNRNNNCLNELKFCEVSRNSISNRCWKFQLSILRNKNVLFLKRNYAVFNIKTIKALFVYWPNFQWRFCLKDAIISWDLVNFIINDLTYSAMRNWMVTTTKLDHSWLIYWKGKKLDSITSSEFLFFRIPYLISSITVKTKRLSKKDLYGKINE